MPMLPCFLCGEVLDQRSDKNRKPYFICDPCGLQMFVRRKPGHDNLRQLQRELRGRDLPMRNHIFTLLQIRAILKELDGLEGELKKLDSSMSIVSDNKTKKSARKLLAQR